MNIFQYETNAWDLEKYSSKRLPLYGDDRAMPTESGVKARPRCKKTFRKTAAVANRLVLSRLACVIGRLSKTGLAGG